MKKEKFDRQLKQTSEYVSSTHSAHRLAPPGLTTADPAVVNQSAPAAGCACSGL